MLDWLCANAKFLITEGLILSIFVWICYKGWSKLWEPKVIFASHILKDGDTYFVRYMNIGYDDLIDCQRVVKLNTGKKRQHSAYICMGDAETVPVLEGSHAFGTGYKSVTVDISISDMKEFEKRFYATNIKEKANKGTLTLKDIISHYRNSQYFSIDIYITGSSKVSDREQFHKRYTIKHIKNGKFKVVNKRDEGLKWYQRYVTKWRSKMLIELLSECEQ